MNAWLICALFSLPLGVGPIQPKRSLLITQSMVRAATDNPLKNPVDSIVEQSAQRFMATPQATGLSIGIYKDGQMFVYNYGTTDKGQSQLPTAQTLYPIASITKTFAGALLAQAAVEKKVRLDDDIRQYLTGDYPNLSYNGQPIRLFHLLNHRSGLPFLLPNRPEATAGELLQNYSRDSFFADLHTVRLNTAPGQTFSYSNAGAQLLGYILERIYGTSFEQLVRQKLTQPLAMNDTKITLTATDNHYLAKGYNCTGVEMPYAADHLQAAGALKSTITDMLRYVRWNVAEQAEAAMLAHQPTWSNGNQYSAGLNWQMLRSATSRVIWQDGNIPGFSSLCVNYPELDMGVVILSNECDRATASRIAALSNQIVSHLDNRAIRLPN